MRRSWASQPALAAEVYFSILHCHSQTLSLFAHPDCLDAPGPCEYENTIEVVTSHLDDIAMDDPRPWSART